MMHKSCIKCEINHVFVSIKFLESDHITILSECVIITAWILMVLNGG